MLDSALPTYSLLSSTRYDDALLNMGWNTRVNGGQPSPFMLLPYHYDRLMAAAGEHGWQLPSNLTRQQLLQACEDAVRVARDTHREGPLKVRILLSPEGTLSAAASPAAPLHKSDFLALPDPSTSDVMRTIYIDSEPTPASRFTQTKTTERSAYNAARARAGLSPLPKPSDAHIDVLLYSPDGFVSETSIRNVAVRRGEKWITPHVQSGSLPGVVRRLMLEEGLIEEGAIRKEELRRDEVVLTMNSVEGCCLGRIACLSDIAP